MDKWHGILIVLLIICIELLRRFYNNYIVAPPYDIAFLPNTIFKTGDLIFFRALDSKHLIFTNAFFSHVGIIIEYHGIPYILELTEPNVKFSPIEERLSQYFSGLVFVKPLKKHLDEQRMEQIASILKWSELVDYPVNNIDHPAHYIRDCLRGLTYWERDVQNHDFNCMKFIVFILAKFGLIHGNEDIGCSGMQYLSELECLRDGYCYDKTHTLASINNDNLEEKYGKRAGVLTIGRGGENMVKYSIIRSLEGRAGGRPGIGAVMGSKKLKAVIITGTAEIPSADPEELKRLGREGLKDVKNKPLYDFWMTEGTNQVLTWCHETGTLPTFN